MCVCVCVSLCSMRSCVMFVGSPGVGKGTYARRAARILSFGHVSPGDVLRDQAKTSSIIEKYLSSGTLVPEATVFEAVDSKLSQFVHSGVIFDGFPRNYSQALNWIESRQVPDLVVDFKLPESLLIQKLLGRRVCSQCGNLYNVFDFQQGEYSMPAMKPKVSRVCDECGGALVQRSDDTIDIITTRLAMHNETHTELVEYLKSKSGSFVDFHIKTGIAQLPDLIQLMKTHLKI